MDCVMPMGCARAVVAFQPMLITDTLLRAQRAKPSPVCEGFLASATSTSQSTMARYISSPATLWTAARYSLFLSTRPTSISASLKAMSLITSANARFIEASSNFKGAPAPTAVRSFRCPFFVEATAGIRLLSIFSFSFGSMRAWS